MKTKLSFMLALLCMVAQGAWAQTNVTTKEQLTAAITNGADIVLGADINLSDELTIDGSKTVTIDLNGHKLDRGLGTASSMSSGVIYIKSGSTLTINDGSGDNSGKITGGYANKGGAISNLGTLVFNGGTITGNRAGDEGGGIFNMGTATITGGVISGNTASGSGGGISNSGTMTINDCSITGNTSSRAGGGISNGNTLTINGGSITDNNATEYGGGIWMGSYNTFSMKGAITVTGNTKAGGLADNVYLANNNVITVTGSLSGSNIGISMENADTFTSGYSFDNEASPITIFRADLNSIMTVGLVGGEVKLVNSLQGGLQYIERSWDPTNKKVVNTSKTLQTQIAYGATPTAGDYKLVTNSDGDGWFQLGGYSDDDEYYVVTGNVTNNTLNVKGKKVHLILCDNAKLTLSGGILCYNTESNSPTLYIHSQSYGASMGKLDIKKGYKDEAAGIGSDWDEKQAHKRTAGNLTIHGGNLSVTGGDKAAGIGGGFTQAAGNITIYGGDIKAYGGQGSTIHTGGAGIGGCMDGGGHTIIYGGKVYAQSYDNSAGIGSGKLVYNDLTVTNYPTGTDEDPNRAEGDEVTYAVSVVDIYGGEVEAHGGKNGAGIGGGNTSNGVILNVYGGNIKAYGGEDGAGIGGGWDGKGGLTVIHGGTVYAKGGGNGAGIGSGSHSLTSFSSIHGGTTIVNDGHVEAYGGTDAAGIGGGEDGSGGTVKITGGYVYAEGNDYGAGIGGGQDGKGGDVTITGGTVIAKAGRQGEPQTETGNRAIGPGEGCDDYGTLTIGNNMMVQAGYDGDNYEGIFTANLRTSACWYRTSARIEPCTHSSLTYTVSGKGENDTHTAHCKYCTTEFTPEKHNFAGGSTCSVCGVQSTTTLYTIRTYLPKDQGEGTYDGKTYSCQTMQMASGTAFTMPDCPTIVPGLEFVGWEVSNVTADPYASAYTTTGGTIKNAGDPYTISDDVSFIARYQNLDITLKDDADNGEVLSNYNGRTVHSVTLSGRTLWKDGGWNTLCLPFDVTLAGSPLEGATVQELSNADFAGGTLTLTFTDATSIKAGKPYLIKWASGDNLTNPVFNNVTLNASTNDKACSISDEVSISFAGTYEKLTFDADDPSILLVGAGNSLYYPQAGAYLGAQRAYFQLNGITAGDKSNSIKAFVMNFDEEEPTNISDVTTDNGQQTTDSWYTINGVKLNGKPTTKGIYIHNGRKEVVR